MVLAVLEVERRLPADGGVSCMLVCVCRRCMIGCVLAMPALPAAVYMVLEANSTRESGW
jgi:hypothetical protein